ncbi:NADP-dependent oxidoreductase [Sorangium sp. So ce1078]|uniref:NADP-dependent oxidoreductase n=1 Tax=Sorangium sp. So ce1078 TaxID=3133329 RepID=UPI003F602988
MRSDVNRCWRLVSRPVGLLKDSDFTFSEEPIPEPKADGELLVRTLYLSVDPTQRIWLDRDSYVPAIPIGDVVRAGGVGKVVRSNSPDFAPGDLVQGLLGWQDYALLRAGKRELLPASKLPPGISPELALSVFGVTGLTAYFGLLHVGRVKEGETVVVSGAAGATGMMAGQIAKVKGCRAIGIAGGPEKCVWLTGELGFDASIDYRSEDVAARLRELCPSGIDIYFDNVGGAILDAALAQLAMRGRVVLSGAIGDYTASEAPPGPKNYVNLLMKRGRMEGFIVTDHLGHFNEAVSDLVGWVSAGKIKNRVDVQEGLERAPATLNRLFTSANTGKQLLKVADA